MNRAARKVAFVGGRFGAYLHIPQLCVTWVHLRHTPTFARVCAMAASHETSDAVQSNTESKCRGECELEGRAAISASVAAALAEHQIIDVHTHLFPPHHGECLLWGIDNLLTYHYLVAELFVVVGVDVATPESFFALPTRGQADIVWRELFVNRVPMSEACRGVLSTLKMLGFTSCVKSRSLSTIREQEALMSAEERVERVFRLAGVRYAVMTNEPFLDDQAKWWRDRPAVGTPRLRAALRVDPLLSGDIATIRSGLERDGFPIDMAGVRAFLLHWAKAMSPEYLMASVPPLFSLEPAKDRGDVVEFRYSPSEFVRQALLPVAAQLDLPIAFKVSGAACAYGE